MSVPYLDDKRIHLDVEFSSSVADHRTNVRRAIRSFLQEEDPGLSVALLADIEDLSKPPRLAFWALSISHCPLLGGFVAQKKSSRSSSSHLGFDLELANRVSPQVAARVAAFSQEKQIVAELIRREYSAAAFWAAKESAIKAFGNRDPELKPHFGIVEILSFNFDDLRFSAKCNGARADGFVFAAKNTSVLSTNLTKHTEIVAALAETKP